MCTLAKVRVMLVVMITTFSATAYGQGITVTGVGPVNRSMGGAGTAAPLEAIGALHWNPASISALPRSQASFAVEGLLADIDLTSSIGGVSSTTNGDPGIAVIPSVGWVHHVENTPVTIGLGLYGIGGFRNAMPRDASNPLLSNGPLFADAEILQIAPTFSYAISDQLSVGLSPTITAARMMLDPLGPSPVTSTPTAGTGSRTHWGGGCQAGVYYSTCNYWQLGFSVKTPQWFEEFRFLTPTGIARFNLDYPLILSTGIAYAGFSDWVFAADVRYFDYQNTDGFKELGWRSVFAVAVGAQYNLNDMWQFRLGYNANQNPIQSEDVLTNISTPLVQDQNVATGLTCALACNVDLQLAYVYLIDNSVTGPLPAGVFGPNATVSNKISAHSLALGITVQY